MQEENSTDLEFENISNEREERVMSSYAFAKNIFGTLAPNLKDQVRTSALWGLSKGTAQWIAEQSVPFIPIQAMGLGADIIFAAGHAMQDLIRQNPEQGVVINIVPKIITYAVAAGLPKAVIPAFIDFFRKEYFNKEPLNLHKPITVDDVIPLVTAAATFAAIYGGAKLVSNTFPLQAHKAVATDTSDPEAHLDELNKAFLRAKDEYESFVLTTLNSLTSDNAPLIDNKNEHIQNLFRASQRNDSTEMAKHLQLARTELGISDKAKAIDIPSLQQYLMDNDTEFKRRLDKDYPIKVPLDADIGNTEKAEKILKTSLTKEFGAKSTRKLESAELSLGEPNIWSRSLIEARKKINDVVKLEEKSPLKKNRKQLREELQDVIGIRETYRSTRSAIQANLIQQFCSAYYYQQTEGKTLLNCKPAFNELKDVGYKRPCKIMGVEGNVVFLLPEAKVQTLEASNFLSKAFQGDKEPSVEQKPTLYMVDKRMGRDISPEEFKKDQEVYLIEPPDGDIGLFEIAATPTPPLKQLEKKTNKLLNVSAFIKKDTWLDDAFGLYASVHQAGKKGTKEELKHLEKMLSVCNGQIGGLIKAWEKVQIHFFPQATKTSFSDKYNKALTQFSNQLAFLQESKGRIEKSINSNKLFSMIEKVETHVEGEKPGNITPINIKLKAGATPEEFLNDYDQLASEIFLAPQPGIKFPLIAAPTQSLANQRNRELRAVLTPEIFGMANLATVERIKILKQMLADRENSSNPDETDELTIKISHHVRSLRNDCTYIYHGAGNKLVALNYDAQKIWNTLDIDSLVGVEQLKAVNANLRQCLSQIESSDIKESLEGALNYSVKLEEKAKTVLGELKIGKSGELDNTSEADINHLDKAVIYEALSAQCRELYDHVSENVEVANIDPNIKQKTLAILESTGTYFDNVKRYREMERSSTLQETARYQGQFRPGDRREATQEQRKAILKKYDLQELDPTIKISVDDLIKKKIQEYSPEGKITYIKHETKPDEALAKKKTRRKNKKKKKKDENATGTEQSAEIAEQIPSADASKATSASITTPPEALEKEVKQSDIPGHDNKGAQTSIAAEQVVSENIDSKEITHSDPFPPDNPELVGIDEEIRRILAIHKENESAYETKNKTLIDIKTIDWLPNISTSAIDAAINAAGSSNALKSLYLRRIDLCPPSQIKETQQNMSKYLDAYEAYDRAARIHANDIPRLQQRCIYERLLFGRTLESRLTEIPKGWIQHGDGSILEKKKPDGSYDFRPTVDIHKNNKFSANGEMLYRVIIAVEAHVKDPNEDKFKRLMQTGEESLFAHVHYDIPWSELGNVSANRLLKGERKPVGIFLEKPDEHKMGRDYAEKVEGINKHHQWISYEAFNKFILDSPKITIGLDKGKKAAHL